MLYPSTECNSTAQLLLIRAVEKQLLLRQQDEWRKELPDRCPPILWFGDSQSKKPIILTVAANPSRKEYISDSSEQALKKVQENKALSYLEKPNNRFRVLKSTEKLADIINNKPLQKDIINGYNSYFCRLNSNNKYFAYTRWFGMNKTNSYNVEGFLRGFGASYYYNNNLDFQAIHIDLLPFTTLSDFKHLLQNKNINKEDLFGDEWAANLIKSLIKILKPSLLIIFGRTNFNYFSQYIDDSISNVSWERYKNAGYCIGKATKIELFFIGLSTNLGNPRGFTANSLNQYGQHIRKKYYNLFEN